MKRSDWDNLDLPDKPGVYQFMDAEGVVLYIGKATSLRSRTRSYFTDDLIERRGERIVEMVKKASTIDCTVTDSVLEALILEANSIRAQKPPYNILGKDGRSFNMVVITNEQYPRIFLERERVIQSGEYDYKIRDVFGPYPHGQQIRIALNIIRKIFPFRNKKSKNQTEEQFYKQLQLSPDTGSEEARQEYLKTIGHIRTLLRGNKKSVIKQITKQMHEAAERQEFERAARMRNAKHSLEHINDVALIKKDRISPDGDQTRIEAYDIAHTSGKHMVGVMTVVIGGVPATDQYRQFNIRGFTKSNDPGALAEVLERRLNHPEWPFPNVIVMDGSIAQYNAAKGVLLKSQLEIDVIAVVKDAKHKPKSLMGNKTIINNHKEAILLANAESHRFALRLHRKKRDKIG